MSKGRQSTVAAIMRATSRTDNRECTRSLSVCGEITCLFDIHELPGVWRLLFVTRLTKDIRLCVHHNHTEDSVPRKVYFADEDII